MGNGDEWGSTFTHSSSRWMNGDECKSNLCCPCCFEHLAIKTAHGDEWIEQGYYSSSIHPHSSALLWDEWVKVDPHPSPFICYVLSLAIEVIIHTIFLIFMDYVVPPINQNIIVFWKRWKLIVILGRMNKIVSYHYPSNPTGQKKVN